MKVIIKDGSATAKLSWPAGKYAHLEKWFAARQGSKEAVKALEQLVREKEEQDTRIDALIDRKMAEVKEFLDTVNAPVLSSCHEKQHKHEEERRPKNLDAAGVVAGME